MQAYILELPTEILWIIASALHGHDVYALTQTQSVLYFKLRPALIRHNIRYQSSSALHWAAKTDNCDFARTLLAYRADVNVLVNSHSPLMIAAKYDSRQVSEVLLHERKLRVNKRNANGKTALWYGVKKRSFPVVNQLLHHPLLKIDMRNREKQTVLWLAVDQGDRDLVSLLLSKGANPNLKDQDGISPWIQACINNRNSITYLIIDHWKAKSPEIFSSEMVTAKA